MDKFQTVHFIGIGGYGMSGIAQVLHESGYRVTGSDAKPSDRTEKLTKLGLPVQIGHRPENLNQADVVVYSTDVPAENPELAEARCRGLRVLHRSEMLAQLINPNYGIAVSGTHGKTTTTSMIAVLLEHAGFDPTALIGGEVERFGGTARCGRSNYVVAEADESDGTFLRYHPMIAVATNVEAEHLEHYGHDFNRVLAAFEQWIGQVRPGGVAVVCGDDPHLQAIAARASTPAITYGMGGGNDWTARNAHRADGATHYQVVYRGQPVAECALAIPGEHNVVNSLAAIAVARHLGIDWAEINAVLSSFGNAKRRFQVISEAGGVRVVDDYAHHPTEIRATLRAAREGLAPCGRLIAVFQPQRYVRTYHLMDQFARAFGLADIVLLTEIYSPPGEVPIPGVSAAKLAELISAHDNRAIELISDKEALVQRLLELARPGDTVLTMGAGDIWQVARDLGRQLAAAQQAS